MLPLLPPIVARACAHGTRVAIHDRTGRYTYDQLDRASTLSRAAASRRPRRSRTRLASLSCRTRLRLVAIQWGIWRAGGIAVPLPMSHPAAELDYLVRDSEASIVIADTDNADVIEPLSISRDARFHVMRRSDRYPNNPHDAHDPYRTLLRRALIVYTSGTTGRPKGVVTTHGEPHRANRVADHRVGMDLGRSHAARAAAPSRPRHPQRRLLCAVERRRTRDAAEIRRERRRGIASRPERLTVFTAVPTIYHRLIGSWEAAGAEVQDARARGVPGACG